MAQKVQVILEDDIDGGDADETVSFSLDGVSYEIDLSATNAERLRDALSAYVGSARRIGGRTSTSRPRRSASSASPPARSTDTAAIREWARDNGHQINDRGRISSAVRAAYEAAHGG